MTYSSANIVFFDLELPKRVSHMKDILSKLSHALDEVQHGMRVFNELHLSEVVALPYRDEVHEMSATTKSFLDKVSVLADHVKLTDFSFLLDRTWFFPVSAYEQADFVHQRKVLCSRTFSSI